MFSCDFQWNLSHKLVLISLGLLTWRKYKSGILSYCFNNYILQLHQLQPHFAPIDKLSNWYADSIQVAVHFQHLGFIHIRCWSCCNMLLYITINIANIKHQNVKVCIVGVWFGLWVVVCLYPMLGAILCRRISGGTVVISDWTVLVSLHGCCSWVGDTYGFWVMQEWFLVELQFIHFGFVYMITVLNVSSNLLIYL